MASIGLADVPRVLIENAAKAELLEPRLQGAGGVHNTVVVLLQGNDRGLEGREVPGQRQDRALEPLSRDSTR